MTTTTTTLGPFPLWIRTHVPTTLCPTGLTEEDNQVPLSPHMMPTRVYGHDCATISCKINRRSSRNTSTLQHLEESLAVLLRLSVLIHLLTLVRAWVQVVLVTLLELIIPITTTIIIKIPCRSTTLDKNLILLHPWTMNTRPAPGVDRSMEIYTAPAAATTTSIHRFFILLTSRPETLSSTKTRPEIQFQAQAQASALGPTKRRLHTIPILLHLLIAILFLHNNNNSSSTNSTGGPGRSLRPSLAVLLPTLLHWLSLVIPLLLVVLVAYHARLVREFRARLDNARMFANGRR